MFPFVYMKRRGEKIDNPCGCFGLTEFQVRGSPSSSSNAKKYQTSRVFLHYLLFLFPMLTHRRYEIPTPIQRYCIPAILEGHDLLSCAQTGRFPPLGLDSASLLRGCHVLKRT